MSFEDINNHIRSTGGDFVKLTKKEHGGIKGKVLDVKIRDKEYQGKVIPNKKGEPRKEWLFSLETEDGVKKWSAGESAQWAIRGALNGRKIQQNGLLQVTVTEDSVQGQKQAEYKVIYSDPVIEFPVEEDEPPY